jgi:hypothetical protein
MARRSKQKELSQSEMARFLAAATELHDACCDPRLAVGSDARKALSALNSEICGTIEKLGHDLPWVNRQGFMTGLRGG